MILLERYGFLGGQATAGLEAAYRASLERIRALRPRQVLFSHDDAVWLVFGDHRNRVGALHLLEGAANRCDQISACAGLAVNQM